MKKAVPILWVGILIFCTSAYPFDILKDLVVNYSNFEYITTIAVGFDYVYFGTTNGVIRYNISKDMWDDPMTGYDGLEGHEIKALKVSKDDQHVWVQTEMGFFEYSDAFARWDFADGIPADEPTNGKHLQPDPSYFPPPGFTYANTGAIIDQYGRSYPLMDIIDDNWSNLWIGTWGMGAFRADDNSRMMEPIPFGLLQPDVSTIYSDNGVLWMGGIVGNSPRTGITVFNWKNNVFSFIESKAAYIFQVENVNDISGGKKGVYAASDNGIWVIDRKNQQIKDHIYRNAGLPDNQVWSLAVTGDTIFAGTAYGLGMIYTGNDSSGPAPQVYLTDLAIYTLDLIDGDLWIGTSQGAYRLSLANGKLSKLTAQPIPQAGSIRRIAHSSNKIWLATADNLVSIDRGTADVTEFPEVNSYGGARACAVTDDLVAVATPQGLLLFFLGPKVSHYLYTVNDGLISNNIKDLAFDGDYIWVGTDLGLTRFWYKNPELYH